LKLNSLLAGTLALVLITGLGAPAFAGEVIEEPGGETITFEFGFLVTDFDFEGGLTSTQEVEDDIVIPITIAFDADMPDQSSADDFGVYLYDKASINLADFLDAFFGDDSLALTTEGDFIFESSSPFSGEIEIVNDLASASDQYTVANLFVGESLENPDFDESVLFGIQLHDFDGMVFGDDSLPLTPLNLADFEANSAIIVILPDEEIPLGQSISSIEDLALIEEIDPIIIEGEIIYFINPIDTTPIGGELLPIDSAALLLAGAQTNALWIMSALAVIGSVAFGALYITSKKN
jgi:hypothetical protein